MPTSLELERTFLLNSIPDHLLEYSKKYLMDIYLPPNSDNPQIRLRQTNDVYYLTKKYPKIASDLSTMIEETINFTKIEFDYFKTILGGKILEKNRYTKKYSNYQIDLDVYLNNLSPLIILDIEVDNLNMDLSKILSEFDIQKEVTGDKRFAGGIMAGKNYNEIL
jgi:CYTH domain-containing protein